MFAANSSFEHLMECVRAGDAEAARELFERYGKAILKAVRRRLNQRLRTEFDSLDFVQEAWASFFHIPPERFTFQTPEDLIAFLKRLAENKVYDAYRQRFRTQRRDASRVQPLQENTPEMADQHQSTPSQFAIAEEEWDRILRRTSPENRRALEMVRAGYTRQEIAQNLGLHPKRLQRLLHKLNPESKTS